MAGNYARAVCSRCGQRVWLQNSATPGQCRRCELNLEGDVPSCFICLEPPTLPIRYTKISNESWENSRCTHRPCRECMRTYVRSKVQDGTWNIRCPGESCTYMLVEADLRRLLGAETEGSSDEDESALERYFSLRSACYGEHLRSILRLQGVGCTEERTTTTSEPEEPSSASTASSEADPDEPQKESERESSGDFELWAQQQCQACPKCLVVIRKEIGCDHIVCRCGESFCFGCGGSQNSGNQCVCSQFGSNDDRPKLGRWLLLNKRLGLTA